MLSCIKGQSVRLQENTISTSNPGHIYAADVIRPYTDLPINFLQDADGQALTMRSREQCSDIRMQTAEE